MANIRAPRHGSLAYWPRKRAKKETPRVGFWPQSKLAKPLGFLGYKAGMTHCMMIDNNPRSMTKDQEIFVPVTVIECPPLQVIGAVFYKSELQGKRKIAAVLADTIEKNFKELGRKVSIPKKISKKLADITDFDDVRLLVATQPGRTGIGAKKPKISEIGMGGTKEEKLKYAQEKLGNEISISDVFAAGALADVHGVTTGKGFQGTVKRYGIPIRQHKAEKTKRGIATLGPWTPKKVDWRVPISGKMGYHLRTEWNKWILKIGAKPEEINPKSGFRGYGIVKNQYVLIKGSLPVPRTRVLTLVHAIRPNPKIPKEAPQLTFVGQ